MKVLEHVYKKVVQQKSRRGVPDAQDVAEVAKQVIAVVDDAAMDGDPFDAALIMAMAQLHLKELLGLTDEDFQRAMLLLLAQPCSGN